MNSPYLSIFEFMPLLSLTSIGLHFNLFNKVFLILLSPGVAVAPQGGQADYSAQWIEYYRSMGMTREAEAIEQQARVSYFILSKFYFSEISLN